MLAPWGSPAATSNGRPVERQGATACVAAIGLEWAGVGAGLGARGSDGNRSGLGVAAFLCDVKGERI